MVSSEVARRYAAGLFALAAEKNMLDQIADEVNLIGEVCRQDRSLQDFLAAPQITDQNKEQLLHSVFQPRVSEPTWEFLDLVVKKRRSRFLIEIAERFSDLVLERKGFLKTHVVTTLPLREAEIKALTARLENKTGKKVVLTLEIDPGIIGGIIVFLGNQVIDNSIRHELVLLRDRLLELKVH